MSDSDNTSMRWYSLNYVPPKEQTQDIDKNDGGVSMKHDSGKLRYDLIPPRPLKSLARVLSYGAEKYAPNSWQNLDDFKNRYYAALMRHLEAWRLGENFDPESHLYHLEHAFCNLMFLVHRYAAHYEDVVIAPELKNGEDKS